MGKKRRREEPWYRNSWRVALLSLAVAVLALAASIVIYVLQSRDTAHVEFVPARTRIVLHEGDGQPHVAILSLLSKGNRGTVVREIRLVDSGGQTIRGYRSAPVGECDPLLPITLGAPDERAVTLRISPAEEARLNRIEVDAIEGAKPIVWPYVRISGLAEGHGGAFGTLTITPAPAATAPGETAKASDGVVDELIPAKNNAARPAVPTSAPPSKTPP
ncbi:MAG: hypothetical protein QM704_14815 [Anaeromyxobacteraceae bacterium]